MLHSEYVTGNPFTGRQVWIIRHIPDGEFGDKYDWCCNVIKPHHFARYAIVEAMIGQGMTMKAHRELVTFIKRVMGFKRIKAERHGKWREY